VKHICYSEAKAKGILSSNGVPATEDGIWSIGTELSHTSASDAALHVFEVEEVKRNRLFSLELRSIALPGSYSRELE